MAGRKGTFNKYAGVVFRSLLESSWARAFDAAGVGWWYEPTAVWVGNFQYTPDFFLEVPGCYCEVKPIDPFPCEFFKACQFAEWHRNTPFYFLVGQPSRPRFWSRVWAPGRQGESKTVAAFEPCDNPFPWLKVPA